MCRMWWPLTLTYIFKVIWPWLWKSCLLCNVFSSRSIIFLTWDPIVWVIMRRRGVSSERRRSSCSSFFSYCTYNYTYKWLKWFSNKTMVVDNEIDPSSSSTNTLIMMSCTIELMWHCKWLNWPHISCSQKIILLLAPLFGMPNLCQSLSLNCWLHSASTWQKQSPDWLCLISSRDKPMTHLTIIISMGYCKKDLNPVH